MAMPNLLEQTNHRSKLKTEQDSQMNEEISPFKALDFIRDNASEYAQAKANVVYMTEYRKTVKATLMASSSERTESAKETYAYSHPEYKAHLIALEQAVAKCERLRWLMIAAEAKISVWQTLEATERMVMKKATV